MSPHTDDADRYDEQQHSYTPVHSGELPNFRAKQELRAMLTVLAVVVCSICSLVGVLIWGFGR